MSKTSEISVFTLTFNSKAVHEQHLCHGVNNVFKFLRRCLAIDVCSSGRVRVGNMATVGLDRGDVIAEVAPAWRWDTPLLKWRRKKKERDYSEMSFSYKYINKTTTSWSDQTENDESGDHPLDFQHWISTEWSHRELQSLELIQPKTIKSWNKRKHNDSVLLRT